MDKKSSIYNTESSFKLFVLLLIVFISFIFYISFVSAWPPDYYWADETSLCHVPGGYTYLLNLSEFYDWSEDPIGFEVSFCDLNYRIEFTQSGFGILPKKDVLYINGYWDTEWDGSGFNGYGYMTIPWNSSYITLYSYGEILVFETSPVDYFNYLTYDTKLVLKHNLDGDWCDGYDEQETVYEFRNMGHNSSCSFPAEAAGGGSPPPVNIYDGLVVHFSFEDGTGYRVTNNASAGEYGYMYGMNSSAWTTGKVGKGLEFFGVNANITMNNITGIDVYNNITQCSWLKLYHSDAYSYFHTEWTANYFWGFNSDGTKARYYNGPYNDGSGELTSTTSLNNGTWFYVCMNRDSTKNNCSIWVNGKLESSNSCSGDGGSYASHILGFPSSESSHWNGVIDQYSLWNRSLNVTEMQEIPTANIYSNLSGGGSESLNKIAEIPDSYIGYLNSTEINLNTYFENWYDLAVLYVSPVTSALTGHITGYGSSVYPYFSILNSESGYYGNLTLQSFGMNYTIPFDVFACDDVAGGIDDFCPVAGYPGSCNWSAFYTTDTCVNSTFLFNINETYVYPVVRDQQFSLYYVIDSDYDDRRYFPMSSYYNYYTTINITFVNESTNYTYGCILGGSPVYLNLTGDINVTMQCTADNVYLYLFNVGSDYNESFWVVASNSNNSISDDFFVLTGDYASLIVSESSPFNIKNVLISFAGILPEQDSAGQYQWAGYIIILAMICVCVMFICIPLKFNKASLWISYFIVLFSILILCIGDYLNWLYFIIPAVTPVLIVLGKLMFGGSS